MLTVLHLAPKLKLGGTAAMAADLAEALELGGEVHNIVMSPTGRRGTRVLYVNYPLGKTLLLGGLVLHSYLVKMQVDVVIAYTEAAAWAAARARRKLPAQKRPALVGALSAYPHKHLLGCGWKGCDAFTAVSRHVREKWEKFSPLFRRKTPWVIPYGMRETWCHPGYHPSQTWKEAWNNRFPTSPGTLTICLPAPLTPLHGHEDLVPLLAALRRNDISPKVFLVGDPAKAAPHYPERLKELFRKSKADRDIVWVGARSDLRDILCTCNITLSLDRQPATYNRPMLEALCLGRPVAGYDHGVAGELLSAFLPEGRVAPGQVEALADTITQWSFYRPTTLERIPYPYRLGDMAESYLKLFKSMRD